jgi:hypothetical protein
LKLRQGDAQQYEESMSEALKLGGLNPYLANPAVSGQTLGKVYRVVHVTDRQMLFAEIERNDVLLTAKADGVASIAADPFGESGTVLLTELALLG